MPESKELGILINKRDTNVREACSELFLVEKALEYAI